MRRIIFWLLLLQLSALCGAQFEIINEIEENPMHMGLAMMDDELKNDNRGELGALVIINCGLKDVLFQNSAMKISQVDKTGAYWLVMKQRAKHFIISREGFPNYKYDFPSPLQSGNVYKMTIDEKNKQADTITLVITSNEDDASVYLNDKLLGKTANKIFIADYPLGENQLELRKAGFTPKKVTHLLDPENNQLEIKLNPAMPAAVTITTDPEGASVYIDNVLFGISPKSSFFAAGTYPLKIEKESYASINEEITITEPETKKHFKMQDMRATLTINTSENASIELNGKLYPSVKNLKLPASVVEIEISQPKAETIKRVITLKHNEVMTLDIYPQVQSGTIVVVTIPTTASIELSGDAGERYTAIGRKSFNDIPIGTYELLVANDGYKSHKETIKLTLGNIIQKQISLIAGSDIIDGFVFVKGGTFQMGSNDGEDDDEKPVHSVTVSDFYISKYEVMQAEWQVIMGNNPAHFKGDNNPVEQVSWYDAVDFCNKKSIKAGLNPVYSGSGDNIKCDFSKNGYRLPTEAEWEYAARGGNKSKGYEYSGSDNLGEVAEYAGNNDKSTKAVGGKKANELGIYDMTGNVLEWCWDRYDGYNNTKQTDPVGPNMGSFRVNRGGSWFIDAALCRLAIRYYNNPTLGNYGIGFRVARSSN